MKKRFLIPLLTSCLFSAISHAENPAGVMITSLMAHGNGCPEGSYSANISPDGQSFSILLDKYIAAVTMQVPFAVQSCQFSINLLVPSGWTFALTAADYRGFAYAEVNTTVAHQASYSFEGGTPIRQHRKHAKAERHAFRIHEIRGPFNDNYTIHQELDARTAPWAPCHSENSQTLTVTTALMAKNLIRNSNRQAQISLDSFDGNLQSQKYQLSWKKCRKEQPKPPKNPPQRDQGRDGGRREKPEHGQSDGRRR